MPSAAEFTQREQARAAVVQAVLGLEDDYREVIVLRWFEGRAPGEIARLLGLPVETVRTRHRRAIEQLRARLDRTHGRAAWAALLVPLAGRAGAGGATATVAAAVTGGVLLMTMNAKVALFAAVAVAVAGVLWQVRTPGPATSPAASPAPAAVAPAVAGVAEAAPRVEPAADAPRDETAVRALVPTASVGALTVHVTWEEDGTPASGADVVVVPEDRSIPQGRGATDAAGAVRMLDLPPGSYTVALSTRCRASVADQSIELAAGGAADVQFAIPSGVDVTGVVVDGAGAPIAAATVVAAMPGGLTATAVARADAAGRFAVRDLYPMIRVGARAEGRVPSPLQPIAGSRGASAEVRLVLDRTGARLSGFVGDRRGDAVAGARVYVGDADFFAQVVVDTRTDGTGRFSFKGLPIGNQRLTVVADDLAPWSGEVPLHVGENAQDVFLDAGATVVGTARLADGMPLEGADVLIEGAAPLAGRSVDTGSDGAFALRGLAGGSMQLRLVHPRHGSLTVRLRAAPGETVRWDPVLGTGLVLRGRVVDSDGEPIAHVHVDATRRGGRPSWNHSAFSAADGSFELPDCDAGWTLRIECRRAGGVFPELSTVITTEANGELVLRLPPRTAVRLRGRVLDADGEPKANVELHPLRRGHGNSPVAVNAADGTFEVGPYPAGEYAIGLRCDGFAHLVTEFRALADGEVRDLGDLRLQRGGTLRAVLTGPLANLPGRALSVVSVDGVHSDVAKLENGVVTSGNLSPGDWVLQVDGFDVAAQQVPFSIRAGEVTELLFEPASGSKVGIHVAVPRSDASRIVVRVCDAADRPVLVRATTPTDGQVSVTTLLRPGRYRVTVECASEGALPALAGSSAFEVADQPKKVEVTLASK